MVEVASCPNCGFDLRKLEPVQIGRFHYSLGAGFSIDGKRLELEQRHHELLGTLMFDRGQVVSYDAIMARLGREWRMPRAAVAVLVHAIREAFARRGVPVPFETVYGRGLRWTD